MVMNNITWKHSARSSKATYHHLTLTVTSRWHDGSSGIYETLWKWTVCGPDSIGIIATSGGLEVDRIGACAEAEENARKRVENTEEGAYNRCSICGASVVGVPLKKEEGEGPWVCCDTHSCSNRLNKNRCKDA